MEIIKSPAEVEHVVRVALEADRLIDGNEYIEPDKSPGLTRCLPELWPATT
jgi:hypothetical protein